MARQRMLHPRFFRDAELLALSPLHRILFEGLWCVADREGRLKDKPADLKIELLPGDACDVDQLLADLAEIGRIVRYQVGGGRFIWIPKFLEYQHPHRNEAPSTIPPPPAPAVGPRPSTQGQPEDGPRTEVWLPKARPTRAESVTESVTVTDPPPPAAVVVAEGSLWRRIQAARSEAGAPREHRPCRGFTEWETSARAAGHADEELLVGYVRYLQDPSITTPGHPTSVWIHPEVWPLRVPPPPRARPTEAVWPGAPPADPRAAAAWGGVLAKFAEDGRAYALTWLELLVPVQLHQDDLVLMARDRFQVDWLVSHYGGLVHAAAAECDLRVYVRSPDLAHQVQLGPDPPRATASA